MMTFPLYVLYLDYTIVLVPSLKQFTVGDPEEAWYNVQAAGHTKIHGEEGRVTNACERL